MTKLCNNRSSIRDCFASILVFAPGPFPGNKTTTLESEFEDIDQGIAVLEARAKHPDALTALSRCREMLKASYQLYEQGSEVEARKELLAAEQLFVASGKLRPTDSSKPSEGCSGSTFQLSTDPSLPLDGATIVGTTSVAPALVVKRFGKPRPGDGYKVSGEFAFTNVLGDAFILHDWLSTKLYIGSEPTPERFWASVEEHELCVSSLDLDCTDFLEWLGNEIG